jgi:hypothetical protein
MTDNWRNSKLWPKSLLKGTNYLRALMNYGAQKIIIRHFSFPLGIDGMQVAEVFHRDLDNL